MAFHVNSTGYPEMESELSSLEIGFIDIMDEVSVIPIGGGGIPIMPGHQSLPMSSLGGLGPMGSMGVMGPGLGPMGIPHRMDNDSLLLSPHEHQMPFLLDHELTRKRARTPEAGNERKRDVGPGSFGNFEETKKQRKPQVHKKCEHNTRKSECKLCGGSQVCVHKRIKSRCKECGGSQICVHRKIRTRCKECRALSERRFAPDDGMGGLQHMRV